MRIGILGLGKMGEAIVRGLQKSGHREISATRSSAKTAAESAKRFNIDCHTDNARLVKECEVIVLCVKPQLVDKVLKPLTKDFKAKQLIISVVSGLSTERLSLLTGGKASTVRAMPNTPAVLGAGVTLLCTDSGTHEDSLQKAESLLSPLGLTLRVTDAQFDAATAISGCGPAYVYMIIEALSDGGVKMGLPRAMARQLAAQTLIGASRMVLESGEHPATLKDAVTTPGGMTIEGVAALEKGRLRSSLIQAVAAATEKARAMAKPRVK